MMLSREEAKAYVVKMYFDDDCFGQDFEAFVESIYDGFEQEVKDSYIDGSNDCHKALMESLERRTCESCNKKQSCEAFASAWNQYKVDYNEFGCSLWESKQC